MDELKKLIRDIGREPVERTTTYEIVGNSAVLSAVNQ